MTFCLGMSVDEGIVGIADTLVTSGRECITLRKASVYRTEGGPLFVMTSGLRSVRDKTLTYYQEALDELDRPFDRMYEAVNLLAKQIRRVSDEDRDALAVGKVHFNIHAIVGGQMRRDSSHKLYMVYPEGNWVDTGPGTPYQMIGATGYGKPILDRALKVNDTMRHAFKVGCLSFDSTRISAADVGFPLDAVLYRKNTFEMVEHRYSQRDLAQLSSDWQDRIRLAMGDVPSAWADPLFDKLDETTEK